MDRYRVRYLMAAALLCAAIARPVQAAARTDYDLGLEAYRRGNHGLARLYFEGVLRDPDQAHYSPDAVYHLALIHDARGEIIEFMDRVHQYLRDHAHGAHATELLAMLLQRLIDEGAYRLAARYVQQYEYLVGEGLNEPLVALGRGLLGQGAHAQAGHILTLCGQSDTVKVLRAAAADVGVRHEIYQTLSEPARSLYLAEHRLLVGDTVGAFMAFRSMVPKDLAAAALYRYARLALLFDRAAVPGYAARLRAAAPYRQKAVLLQAIADGEPVRQPVPEPADAEEVSLCQRLYGAAYIAKEIPEEIDLKGEPADSGLTLERLRSLRRQYPGRFFLDSLYAWLLVEQGDHAAAATVVAPYLKYANTQAYARVLAGLHAFARHDHEAAARNVILSNRRDPRLLYVLAECLSATDHHAPDLFQPAMNLPDDPDLQARARRGYVLERYQAQAYGDICGLEPALLAGDTVLIRVYARSLARCGALARADSIARAHFSDPDPELLDLYGQFLIERKEYARAAAHYDSLAAREPPFRHDGICYHGALIALLQGQMADALDRFREYAGLFPAGRHLHEVQFKIATLKFLVEEFDSAAVYYGLSAADPALAPDARENQLISYKKAGQWAMVIEAGRAMLSTARQEREADIRFEIGYASLRAGRANDAIEELQIAARLKPEPATFYWLGEAYLARADFAAAFHSFQQIIEAFANDEMWVPTAQYKTGVVLELLDERDAAREVYQRIVKTRGVNDPIGAEAEGRLKALKERP